jgi:hypothetical protein
MVVSIFLLCSEEHVVKQSYRPCGSMEAGRNREREGGKVQGSNIHYPLPPTRPHLLKFSPCPNNAISWQPNLLGDISDPNHNSFPKA